VQIHTISKNKNKRTKIFLIQYNKVCKNQFVISYTQHQYLRCIDLFQTTKFDLIMISRQEDFFIGTIIFGIISLVLTILTVSNGSDLCWMFLGFFIVSIILFVLIKNGVLQIPDYKKNIAAKKLLLSQESTEYYKVIQESENQKQELINKYGKLSKMIAVVKYAETNLGDKILIFESSSIIVIRNKVFNFVDIKDFELKEDEQMIYKSAVSGVISTASTDNPTETDFVGGDLLAEVEAVIGSASANKNTNNLHPQKNVSHKYKIYIDVDNHTHPQVVLNLGKNINIATELVAVLSVILEQNKSAGKNINCTSFQSNIQINELNI